MKKNCLLILFFGGSLLSNAQTKQNGCDNLYLQIDPNKVSDTVTYEILEKWDGFFAFSKDLNVTTHTEVISYEMVINNEKEIKISPPYRHFRNQTLKKKGGTITITNCKVKCWHDNEKPKEYTNVISKTVFYILPAK